MAHLQGPSLAEGISTSSALPTKLLRLSDCWGCAGLRRAKPMLHKAGDQAIRYSAVYLATCHQPIYWDA